MAAPKEILRLVETFDRNSETYKSQQYNETQLRREFIDPFFIAMGWDVNNSEGNAAAYKDVVHEDSIKIGSATKAPDYCFRIGGTRKFFLEAKKPSIDIKGDIGPAYQLRRYAWSAKLPLSILADFEEFAVYDCTKRPNAQDKASTARVMYLNYKEYIERWDEIYSLFSKDAVLKGSFDKYALGAKGKRGTSSVDAEFLGEIDSWREILAKNIALKNESLTNRQLNYTVQLTIDRILFLRMCEDRGIEQYGQLLSLVNGHNVYPRLFQVFERADAKYNSGLFHFVQEKGRLESPDDLTPNLKIDDKPLAEIIKSLYYPYSPYEFSVLPPEILGNVYEQFLGKVIRLTESHQAKIEEKPEVKKAGGVYYTPSYIVDYIVKNTIGKLCEGKTPKQISKLRILDPACGSGSFLIGAYTYLLDYHRDWYLENDPAKYKKQIYQGKGGQWYLTISQKKNILLNNIFGVDIDSQAVEVTKLSLLLKVLENETQESIGSTLKLFQERALPDLAENIKCGNSLIGPDFYENQQLGLFGEEEKYKINAFDWKTEFAEIFKQGGFDAVIGNPPYVQAGLITEYKNYFAPRYSTFTANNDLYVFFIERSFQLLSKRGIYGMIVSNKWIRADYGKLLRKYISNKVSVLRLLDFGELPVFKNVGVFPCIILGAHLQKRAIPTIYVAIKSLPPVKSIEEQVDKLGFHVELKTSTLLNWTLAPSEVKALLDKLDHSGVPIGNIDGIQIRRGVLTGFNPAFVIDETTKRKLISDDHSASKIISPFVSGDETRRYSISWQGRYLIFTHRGIDISKYPSILKYLSEWRKNLEPKKSSKDKEGRKPGLYKWYEIQDATKYYPEFEKPKIIYGQFQIAPHFAFSSSTLYFGSNHYMIVHEDTDFLRYVCGILNSTLYFFYMKHVAGVLGDADDGGRLISQKSHILKFPVRITNPANTVHKTQNSKMVSLVEQMLGLHKKVAEARTPDEKTRLQRQIDGTDSQIDKLVYELYGLTSDEIAIIEKAT